MNVFAEKFIQAHLVEAPPERGHVPANGGNESYNKYDGIEYDALAKIIIPIVEGQIMSFFNDHPDLIAEFEKVHPGRARKLGKTPQKHLTDSIAKRITRQLLCSSVRERLVRASVSSGNSLVR